MYHDLNNFCALGFVLKITENDIIVYFNQQSIHEIFLFRNQNRLKDSEQVFAKDANPCRVIVVLRKGSGYFCSIHSTQ